MIRSLGSGSGEGLLGLDHGFDTVVHVLNEIFLRAAETSLVGDIVGSVGALRVLTVDTADLDEEFVGNFIELDHVVGEQWQLDVHRGSQGSSEVGWAGGDVTEMVVVGELGDLLDGSSGTGQSIEDGSDVGAWLHGDDSELILLIDPHKESLVVVVENSSARWPVAVEAASFEVAVTLPKEIKLVRIRTFQNNIGALT